MALTGINLAHELLSPALDGGHAESTALLWDDGSQTYRALAEAAARNAHAMRATGVGRGDRVPIMLPDGPELVAAFLGAMLAGAVPIVLSTRIESEALRFILADSEARLLLASDRVLREDPALTRNRPEGLADVVSVGQELTGATALESWLAGRPCELAPQAMDLQDMAYWLYTSGTTGRPKAVVHVHRDFELVNVHLTRHLGLRPGERIFTTSKLFFAYSLGHSLLGGLRTGATVVLHAGWPEPASIARVVERTRPHLFLSVPTLYRRLLDAGHAGGPGFDAVRHYVSAGEPLAATVTERWFEATGAPILEGIGTTETINLFIANTPERHRAGSTGRVMPWADARLLGDDGKEVSEAGAPGVLWVRLGTMFAEYWNQPERTASVRHGDWYRTDDVFVRDDAGWWYYRGRRDDMLKISGQWVSPSDVEQAALELRELEDAAAVGWADDDGLTRIVLFAVPCAGEAHGHELEGQIVARLRERLPHHQCPREVRLVESIPRTATGKIKRFELRQQM
jgi:benzoate-CoA ligase